MAIWPWASLWNRQDQDIRKFNNLKNWLNECKSRPALQRGRALHQEARMKIEDDEIAQKNLFFVKT